MRTALRLGRHLTLSFGEPAASGGVGAQLPLVQRLVAAVDSLPASADLAGLTVMIGAANGVDELGTIWLAADGSEAGWARWVVRPPRCLPFERGLGHWLLTEGLSAAAS